MNKQSTSKATLSNKAPLYWSAYQYLYETNKLTKNTYIPQSVWLDNINWIAQNLKPFGYDTICIDGWGDDFTFTENGYRVKHSSKWTHDYQWWAKYLQAKGLTLGIYNNPLWVNMQAVNQGKKIKGTNIPLQNIINRNEHAMFFNWVQIEKDGAREYIKGYVQYYADMGVKYLRVDFLSWFQDGKDRNPDLSRPNNRPRLYYQLALKWIKEACEANRMAFSLVMPHLYNYAYDELIFAGGSMIRVNADVGDGGWQRFNNVQRGVMHQIWSTYDNTFDGFIYWSGLSGFALNNMILDGDFTRINTFANELQKQTVISLQIIGGGPLAITDQFNTIQNDIHYYQNTELLELNYQMFVAKPLVSDLKNSRSQVWVGKTRKGQWIVGLFNRENTDQIRTFNFQSQLSIPQGFIRDLWLQKDLGAKSNCTQVIKSHACKIYKISQYSQQAESPQFSLKGGNYAMSITITLTTKTLGGSIFYTTNGEQPSSQSTLYAGPITAKQTIYLKAITVKQGMADSFIASNIYSIDAKRINNQMCVGGTFTGWALPQMPMSYLGDNLWKSKYINLAKGTYQFKIANSSNWSKDDYGNAQGLKGHLKLTTQTPNNAKFTLNNAGKYGFSFNQATLEYQIFEEVFA